jgi:hypothetical protein
LLWLLIVLQTQGLMLFLQLTKQLTRLTCLPTWIHVIYCTSSQYRGVCSAMRERASLEKSIGTTNKPKENTSNYQCCVLAILIQIIIIQGNSIPVLSGYIWFFPLGYEHTHKCCIWIEPYLKLSCDLQYLTIIVCNLPDCIL